MFTHLASEATKKFKNVSSFVKCGETKSIKCRVQVTYEWYISLWITERVTTIHVTVD